MRKILGEILFWLHLPVVLVWIGFFFFPQAWWGGKVSFHFWFIIIVFASQVLWGITMMPIRKRFGMGVCPLTTLTQYVRGFPISDLRNYNHTFIVEFCERLQIRLRSSLLNTLLVSTLVAVSVQFLIETAW